MRTEIELGDKSIEYILSHVETSLLSDRVVGTLSEDFSREYYPRTYAEVGHLFDACKRIQWLLIAKAVESFLRSRLKLLSFRDVVEKKDLTSLSTSKLLIFCEILQ